MKIPAILILSSIIAISSVKGEGIKIDMRIKLGGDIVALPTRIVSENTPFTIRATRELRYPTRWDLPQKRGEIVVPVTPAAFRKTDLGVTFTCLADSTDGLIRLSGTAVFTDFERMVQSVYGENSKPIRSRDGKVLLTENKGMAPTTVSSTSQFQVFAIPGKKYEFKIKRLNKWIPCFVTCSFTK
jgi:hypothetical protein